MNTKYTLITNETSKDISDELSPRKVFVYQFKVQTIHVVSTIPERFSKNVKGDIHVKPFEMG